MLTLVYVHFFCNSLKHTLMHIHTLQVALSPDSHVPPDSTNQDKLQPFPSPPKTHPIISFSHSCLPPTISPSSFIPSHLALCGRWAAEGPAVIGLDIIYCPLGNVAFQHLIKIISSHSNGRYGLKETLCNHLATRGRSSSLTQFLSRSLHGPAHICVHVKLLAFSSFTLFFTAGHFQGSRQSTLPIIVQKHTAAVTRSTTHNDILVSPYSYETREWRRNSDCESKKWGRRTKSASDKRQSKDIHML